MRTLESRINGSRRRARGGFARGAVAASLAAAVALGWASVAFATTPAWVQRTVPAAAKTMTVDGVSCSGGVCVAITTVCGYSGCGGIPPTGILRSVDRGATWATVAVPDAVSKTNPDGIGGFDLISCWSATSCVLAYQKGPMGPTSTGGILYTTDRGLSWLFATVPGKVTGVTGLTCQPSGRCLAGLENTSPSTPVLWLLSSTNGGRTWSGVTHWPSAVQTNNGLWCWGAHCVATGANSHGAPITAVSANAGATWSVSRLPTGVSGVYGVACPTATKCLTVGYGRSVYSGKVLVSSTGGASWKVATVPAGTGIQLAVACLSASTCLTVGMQSSSNPVRTEALLTTNGGGRWTKQVLPRNYGQLDAVTCVSGGRCIATGQWLTYSGTKVVATDGLILTYH